MKQGLSEVKTRSALGRPHLPPTTVFRRLKTTRRCCDEPRITMSTICTWDFPDIIKFRVAMHTISEKAIRFRHPDYDPDRAQKLTSSSMSKHLSTRKMSTRSLKCHPNPRTRFRAILLTDRQTDRQTSRAIVFTSSVICTRNFRVSIEFCEYQRGMSFYASATLDWTEASEA